jgi:hypothetical protein
MEQVKVTVTINGSQVVLDAPYNPKLPAKAKAIGGRWNAAQKVWTFDARDETRVRELARAIYGTDGSTPTELVTVRVKLSASLQAEGEPISGADVWMFGRNLIHKMGRDIAPILGTGVIIVDGALQTFGGSAAHPAIAFKDGTLTIEVRDVPRELVEESEYIQIVTDAGNDAPQANPLAVVSDEALVAELTRRGYTVTR